jgi:hypothetical protein
VIAAAASITLAASGCGGGSDDEPRPAGRDLTALQCPMARAGEAGGVAQYEPVTDAFDTAKLVGMGVGDARRKAAGHGCEIVVASEDGRGRPVPIEIDPSRIYVFVERDRVSYIEGVGGGI